MKFTPKISGTQITDFKIEPVFDCQVISLEDVMNTIQKQKTMDFILDDFRFFKGKECWWTTMDWDTILKISILENYPEYEKECIEYFGENWLKHYLRFNH